MFIGLWRRCWQILPWLQCGFSDIRRVCILKPRTSPCYTSSGRNAVYKFLWYSLPCTNKCVVLWLQALSLIIHSEDSYSINTDSCQKGIRKKMLQILLQTQETSNRTLILILTNISLYLLHSLCRINFWSPNSSNYMPYMPIELSAISLQAKNTRKHRGKKTRKHSGKVSVFLSSVKGYRRR